MNIENMRKAAKAIREMPYFSRYLDGESERNVHYFDMARYFHILDFDENGDVCNSAGCIAGSTWDEFCKDDPFYRGHGYTKAARHFLGLNNQERDDLFEPGVVATPLMAAVTPEQAAEVMELAADGMDILDAWRKVLPDHMIED